jgi:proteasome lid subunit RPN8/RPN11
MSFTVPEHIHAQVRRHATGLVRPERESVGFLIVKDGVATRYCKVRNTARKDHAFRIGPPDNVFRQLAADEEAVIIHSHPSVPWRRPSPPDLSGANKSWLGKPYAIYHVRSDNIDIFELSRCRTQYRVWGAETWRDPSS